MVQKAFTLTSDNCLVTKKTVALSLLMRQNTYIGRSVKKEQCFSPSFSLAMLVYSAHAVSLATFHKLSWRDKQLGRMAAELRVTYSFLLHTKSGSLISIMLFVSFSDAQKYGTNGSFSLILDKFVYRYGRSLSGTWSK